MKKMFAAKTAALGVLGAGLLFGGSVVAGHDVPTASANGCFGWNGIFIHAQWCGGGPWGGYPGIGYPGGCGGFGGCYPPVGYPPPLPPPPPPPSPPIPIGYPPYGGPGPCGC